jgi:hypothetical protein
MWQPSLAKSAGCSTGRRRDRRACRTGDQLAHQALTILGATDGGTECNACHGLTRQHLRYWRALTDTSMSSCLTDLAVSSQQSAQQMIDCLRAMPTVAASDFAVQHLGVAAAAARLPWFRFTFERAYGDQGDAKLADFIAQVGMPKDTVPPLTQPQFDIVAEYFARAVPEYIVASDAALLAE